MFKIGNKVRVKTYSNIEEPNQSSNDEINFTETMLEFCGTKTTVISCEYNCVFLKKFGRSWMFHESWLEPILVPTKIKISELV